MAILASVWGTSKSYVIVGSPQFQDPLLPMTLLAKQLVYLVVQVPDPELAKTS